MVSKKKGKDVVKDIQRKTRKIYNAEEKITVVIEGLRGEDSIASICRKHGITQATYYKWSKDFIEAGKKRLNGDTQRAANTSEVSDLKAENEELKKAVATLYLKNEFLKKSMTGLE
jgi:transposase